MAEKALHRKQKTGHRDHHLKPGVKWKEPVPAPLNVSLAINPIINHERGKHSHGHS
jgi:hypothetical protein